MRPATLDHDMIRELIRMGRPDRVLRLIGKSHPADIALVFKDLEPNDVRLLFDILFSVRRASKVLKELPTDLLPDILSLIDDEKLARMMVWSDPDDEVTFIDSLPEERRERILALMDPDRRERVEELISYPEGTVGRLMTTDYLALLPTTTAQGAIDKIRERGELETFFYLYVVNEAGVLIGVVPIRNLVVAPPDRTLGEMMISDPIGADVAMDQEEAARLVSKYELLALPIVEQGGRLVFTPVTRSIRMRLPWTLLNLMTASLAASVVSWFEGTIDEIVALVTFMPIVAGVGGNGATQTATVIIRAIALGELEFSSAWRAIFKQVSVNVCLAFAAGTLIAFAAFLWKGNPFLGVVLALAMIINLGLVAGLSGAVIPLVLKSLRFDPAMGSGIIVTGLTDAFGFLSFLGLATLFLSYLS